MKSRYIAFISYRHLPLDAQVAEKLHKKIERYRVPKELRRDPKNPMLGRVFRDREELPLSNDLTQDIYEALDSSEYLIVVCTPQTPQSLWVDREIQHFLQNHDRNHIITVLADGLPEKSIPPRVTNVYGADGVTVIDRREPLCAYLVDKTPAKVLRNLDKEFLRLVAALLEKPYDSIRQRQKLYRQRRILAACSVVAAVATVFSGVLIAKNREIQNKNEQIQLQNDQITAQNEQIAAQLEQTLLNESEALTLLSQINLEDGDRMTALENALTALPSEGNQRPFYAPAQDALESALYLYDTGYRSDRVLESIGGVYHVLSDNGDYLLADSYRDTVICVDLRTGQTLWEFPKDDYAVMSLWLVQEQNAAVYVSCSGIHYVLDLNDGSLRCQYEFAKRCEPADFSPDGSVMAITDEETVFFCSLTEQEQWQTEPQISGSSTHACSGSYNADGSRFLMICEDVYNGQRELRVRVFDTGSLELAGEFAAATLGERYSWGRQILALEDGSWMLFWCDNDYITHVSRMDETGILTQSELEPLDLSGRTGNIITDLRQVGDRVVLLYPDWICRLDALSGEVVSYTELYWLGDLEAFTLWEDGSILALEGENTFCRYFVDEKGYLQEISDTRSQFPFWTYEGYRADVVTGETKEVFLLWEGSKCYVIRRMEGAGDGFVTKESTGLTLSGNLIYLPNFCGIWASPGGRMLFVMDTDATVDDSGSQFVYDLETGNTVEFSAQRPGRDPAFTADETKLIAGNELFDLQTGEVTVLEGNGIWATTQNNDRIPGTPALTVCYGGGTLRWWLDGVYTGETEDPYFTDGESPEVTVGQNGMVLLRAGENRPWTAYDTGSDTWYAVEAQIDGDSLTALGLQTKRAAFREPDGDLILYDFEQSEEILHVLESAKPADCLFFYEEDESVLAVSAFGSYSSYNVHLEELQIWRDCRFSEFMVDPWSLQLRRDPNGEDLYLASAKGEFDGYRIQDAVYGTQQQVPGMVGYLPQSNSLLCLNGDQTQVYTLGRLEMEDLIAMGEEMLRQGSK